MNGPELSAVSDNSAEKHKLREDEIEFPRKTRWRVCRQGMMVLCISLGHLSTATAGSWTNPALSDMKEHNTTAYGTFIHLDDWQVDMLGSSLALGTIPGCWLWGWLGAVIGRRYSLMVSVIPSILGWSLIAFALNPSMILVGRVMQGIYLGSIAVLGNIYIVELSDTSLRGMFSILPLLTALTGNILCTASGFFLHWYQIPFVGIVLSIIVSSAACLLPESPRYLVVMEREAEARAILLKLRKPNANIEEEIDSLRDLNEEKMKESFYKVISQKRVYQPVLVICTLFFVQNFGGYTVFLYFTTRLIIESGFPLDAKIVSMAVFSVMLSGSVIAALLIDRLGRKNLIIVSLVFMAIFLFITGSYIPSENYSSQPSSEYVTTASDNSKVTEQTCCNSTASSSSGTEEASRYNDYETWVSVTSLLGAAFSSTIGLACVPWILGAEYFPTAVRSQACGLCSVMYSVFNFGVMQLFSSMQNTFTTAGLFVFYGGVCVFGVIFSIFFVTETKHQAIG